MSDEIDIGGEFIAAGDEDYGEVDGGEGADAEEAAAVAEERAVELEQMLLTPGTYFNPQTEVVVVVDDSASVDQDIFNMESYEGADWVRISEESPVDEDERDKLLEQFQNHYHAGAGGGSLSETALEQDDGEEDEGETGQDPGRED